MRSALPIALCLALAGCSVGPAPSVVDTCDVAARHQTYMDILDFQRGLNQAAEHLGGQLQASVAPLFARLDQRIDALAQAGADAPACRTAYGQELGRLRAVRARGEAYLQALGRYWDERKASSARLAKAVAAVRLGPVAIRLVGVDEDGQRLTLSLRNTSRKPLTLVTHALLAEDQPAAVHFLLADELGHGYRLLAASPEFTAKAPMKLGARGEQQLTVSFAGPYMPQAQKLTLIVDANLVSSDPKRTRNAPAALVLPRELLTVQPRPVFLAEPAAR